MRVNSFGFNDADYAIAQREAKRRERQYEQIEYEQAIFDEWSEEQSRIPGSGVYRV